MGGLQASDNELVSVLRRYEKERMPRAAKVTLRARALGKFSDITYKPVSKQVQFLILTNFQGGSDS